MLDEQAGNLQMNRNGINQFRYIHSMTPFSQIRNEILERLVMAVVGFSRDEQNTME
ncbi:MAG TPA: hypothetical protein PLG54_01590 [Bacteroidales bacterium]|nr:hypothetical protein [Bacteroidales bacterium]